ncbi:hypothetical protein ACJMK2_027182 [Sinanodonta woodiana]|uniref:Uncharacterized protein n=1 Tax=Sinanodonta woodiana TaxID=1069815 RepID=A0ABD3XNI2_SINWO
MTHRNSAAKLKLQLNSATTRFTNQPDDPSQQRGKVKITTQLGNNAVTNQPDDPSQQRGKVKIETQLDSIAVQQRNNTNRLIKPKHHSMKSKNNHGINLNPP